MLGNAIECCSPLSRLLASLDDAEVCVRTPTPSYDHEDTDHPTAHSASGGGAMHPVADEEVASLAPAAAPAEAAQVQAVPSPPGIPAAAVAAAVAIPPNPVPDNAALPAKLDGKIITIDLRIFVELALMRRCQLCGAATKLHSLQEPEGMLWTSQACVR